MRPRLLDLFSCEGGAAVGYDRAGWDVTGIDLEPRFAKRYPGRFVAADALAYALEHGHEFDLIHASPPCQGYSIATAGNREARSKHKRMIAVTREVLLHIGKPYILENVAQARSEMIDPILLCGTMFELSAVDDDGTKLEMWRHRLFESSLLLRAPSLCHHGWYSEQVAGSYGGARRDKAEARNIRHGGYVPAKPVQERMLGIDWMTQYGLYQSLPPVYTEFLGTQVLQASLSAVS